MSTEVIVAMITGIATIATVIINSYVGGREMNLKLQKAQAVTDTKLEALIAEVRRHNEFAARMPAVETEIDNIKERLSNVEGKQ